MGWVGSGWVGWAGVGWVGGWVGWVEWEGVGVCVWVGEWVGEVWEGVGEWVWVGVGGWVWWVGPSGGPQAWYSREVLLCVSVMVVVKWCRKGW